MANTRVLTVNVENYVRSELELTYGEPFSKRKLRITENGFHEFDAVSKSELIVASIKSSSGRTSGNKNPSGKISSSIADMYYLSLVPASQRLLILTNAEFFEIMVRTMKGRIGHSINILHIPLPQDLLELVSGTQKNASLEITSIVTTDSLLT